MKYTPSKINRWMLLNLPAAWLSGVRLTLINENKCEVKVRFKWINQNPYRSMFWAVQGMAAELTTGMLLTKSIQDPSVLESKREDFFPNSSEIPTICESDRGPILTSIF